MDSYNVSDHKTLVQNVFLEVAEISAISKKMKAELSDIREDIEALSRSVSDFNKTMKNIQHDVPIAVSESAMISFDEQLKKIQVLQDLLDKLNHGDVVVSSKQRKRWFK